MDLLKYYYSSVHASGCREKLPVSLTHCHYATCENYLSVK